MNNRLYWIRSVSSPDPTEPELTMRRLQHDYPGPMGTISAYSGILRANASSHEIHTHGSEEQIVLLSGELDAFVGDEVHRLGPGGFCHIPSGSGHCVRAVGPENATFLVFKLNGQTTSGSPKKTAPIFFNPRALEPWTEEPGIRRRRICQDQSLGNGGTFTVDSIRIGAQTGCPGHTDAHDVMVILLRGQMQGFPTATAPAIIYYPAEMPHWITPHSPEPVEMILVEFHPGASSTSSGGSIESV